MEGGDPKEKIKSYCGRITNDSLPVSIYIFPVHILEIFHVFDEKIIEESSKTANKERLSNRVCNDAEGIYFTTSKTFRMEGIWQLLCILRDEDSLLVYASHHLFKISFFISFSLLISTPKKYL
jgi:hypothetical protein